MLNRLLFDVYTEEKVSFPVKFLINNGTLSSKIEVPTSKNDDFIGRSPLPVDADARYLALSKPDGWVIVKQLSLHLFDHA